jgi:hypothetical protein
MILKWRPTGINATDAQDSTRSYVFGPCLMIEYIGIWSRFFFAPDGAKFREEQKLIDYMDKKYGTVRTSGGDS